MIDLTYEEYLELPEELKNAMALSKGDILSMQILNILASGDPKHINEIMIDLYQLDGVLLKPKTKLISKLYRMAQQGLIEAAESKGYYRRPA